MKAFMAVVFFLVALEFMSAAPAKKDEYKYLKTHGHIVNIISKPGCNYSYVYDGSLANGKPSGKGNLEIKYPDGQTYKGDCENGLRSGNGTATYPDGSVYVGHFSNDKRDGSGKLCDANGKVLKDGKWKEDQYISDEKETKIETAANKLKEATTGISDLLKKISEKLTVGNDANKQPESVAGKLNEENAKISALLAEISDKLAKRNADIDKQPESVANELKKENAKISNLLQNVLNKLTERDSNITGEDKDKLAEDYKTSDANGTPSGNFWSEAFPSNSENASVPAVENISPPLEDESRAQNDSSVQDGATPVAQSNNSKAALTDGVAPATGATPASKPVRLPAKNRNKQKVIDIFNDELDFSDFFSFI
ncbi:MAG: hypothetical protein LBB12_04350 [Holosporaceae bacterium]|nr:hypothetical protein [Holosporaceae bacterium]